MPPADLAPPNAAEPFEPILDREFTIGADSRRPTRDIVADDEPTPPREAPTLAAEEAAPSRSTAAEEEDPFARIGELMMRSSPQPIPDVFASPPRRQPQPRRGGLVLWLVLFVLLLASAGVGLYYFQDRVIDEYPEAAQIYEKVGLRNEVVGVGLEFRNYNSERMVQDNTEVLIVRGVIANTTALPREIPSLRLALYEGQNQLQEKIISPPQTRLDAHATVGFRITLEQPNPNANRFEVTFTAPRVKLGKP